METCTLCKNIKKLREFIDIAKSRRGFYADITYYRLFLSAVEAVRELEQLPFHTDCSYALVEAYSQSKETEEPACGEDACVKS